MIYKNVSSFHFVAIFDDRHLGGGVRRLETVSKTESDKVTGATALEAVIQAVTLERKGRWSSFFPISKDSSLNKLAVMVN